VSAPKEGALDPIPISELNDLWICRSCAGLNGKPGGLEAQRDGRVQRCSCRRVPGEPRWQGFDVNEHVHLCERCLQEALPGGSRFSVWFCQPCKDRVTRLNDDLRVWLIPIGRHSVMVRTYDPPGYLVLPGSIAGSLDEPTSRAEIRRFTEGTGRMVSSIDRLDEWSTAALLENLRELGFVSGTEVRLSEYLRAIRARADDDGRYSKEAVFERLRVHMLDGRTTSPSAPLRGRWPCSGAGTS
jgi:hypothetical protein